MQFQTSLKFNARLGLSLVIVLSTFIAATIAPLFAHADYRECYTLFEKSNSASERSTARVAGPIGAYLTSTTEVDGRTVYYEYLPAARGKGTAVVFIGLYTPIADFVGFKRAFAEQSRGEGLVLVSYDSMPDSLAAAAKKNNLEGARLPASSLEDFVRQGTAVLNAAGVRPPVTVVGYSYGAAPAVRFSAFHRERVMDLVFVAPLVFNGEHSAEAAAGLAALSVMASVNPMFGPILLENARAQIAQSIAEQFIRLEYDSKAPVSGVARRDLVEGGAARVRATEDFDLRKEDFGLLPRTHFVMGENENPRRLVVQTEAVASAIDAARGDLSKIPTVTGVPGAGHVVIGEKPQAVAEAVLNVMRARVSTSRR